jgi:hypothetical protein
MHDFPDLKFISDVKSGLDIYVQAISQGFFQLMNDPDKNSENFAALKSYTLENISECRNIINKIESNIA